MRYSNVLNRSESNIVLLGVPDESKSKAPRKGAKNGPNKFRKALLSSENFKRSGQLIPICPMKGDLYKKKVFDMGNIKRHNLYPQIVKLISQRKIPIIIGGDHSITNTTLNAIYNITKYGANIIDPMDVQEYGTQKILKKIIETCINNNKNNIYISIDLDCLDPAFAPGVSVPTPCG